MCSNRKTNIIAQSQRCDRRLVEHKSFKLVCQCTFLCFVNSNQLYDTFFLYGNSSLHVAHFNAMHTKTVLYDKKRNNSIWNLKGKRTNGLPIRKSNGPRMDPCITPQYWPCSVSAWDEKLLQRMLPDLQILLGFLGFLSSFVKKRIETVSPSGYRDIKKN